MNVATIDQPIPASSPSTPHEAGAVQAALNGGRVARLSIAARALYRLSKNSEDTTQAILLGVSLNQSRLPKILARMASDPVGSELLETRPAIDSRSVDYAQFRALPDGTLGREYVRFLDGGQLDADFFQAPPGLPPLVAFLAQRIRQSHDVWHVVTGFSSEIPGEIGLQAFTWAQLRAPSAALITVFGLVRWGLQYPSMFGLVARGVRMGRRAQWLASVRWEDHWQRPLSEVREQLGLPTEPRTQS